MADVMLKQTTRQMPAAGLAGLFGLFAGLCAVFAGCVTLGDWYSETRQARWPVVSAVVDRADIEVSRRAHQRMAAASLASPRAASIRRRRRNANRDAGLAHGVFGSGSRRATGLEACSTARAAMIEVRYDPSQPNRAVFAAAELASASGGPNPRRPHPVCDRRDRRAGPVGAGEIFERASGCALRPSPMIPSAAGSALDRYLPRRAC